MSGFFVTVFITIIVPPLEIINSCARERERHTHTHINEIQIEMKIQPTRFPPIVPPLAMTVEFAWSSTRADEWEWG